MNRYWLLVALLTASWVFGVLANARDVVSPNRVVSLEVPAEAFKGYVLEAVGRSLAAVETLRDQIASHDLPGAQHAWLAARGGWERCEVVTAEYFPDLDRAIDGWPDAERGFHAIEARLFGAHNTDALPAAEELLRNLTEFQRELRGTKLTAQHLLNGAARLTYEIGEDKAGGGESPFSGNSLAEMGDNVGALTAVYQQVFAPAARRTKPGLAVRVGAELYRLQALVAVRSLRELDQGSLREVSESLTDDLAGLGQQLGLQRPSMGN